MTNPKMFFLLFFFIGQMAAAYTPQEGNVTAILGPFISHTDFQKTETVDKAPYYGDIGLIAQGDINSFGALEIAMFHLHKAYFRDQEGKTLAEKIEQMHITMGYRYWFNPYFSASLAFSSSHSMGTPQVIHSDFPISSDIDTSARDTVDYGFDFSIQSELWNRDRYSVIADARYALSVTNKVNEQGNHYGLLIGLKYLIQEKYPTLAKKSDTQ